MERRNTIQKQLVLEAVAQLHNHPTAEQVYAQVVKEHPTISKATVYRNLEMCIRDRCKGALCGRDMRGRGP